MALITIVGSMPFGWSWFYPQTMMLTASTATYAMCTICFKCYQFTFVPFVAKIAPWMREKYGKAFTLKFWEIYVSIAWQMRNIGYAGLCFTTPMPYSDSFEDIPSEVTTMIGTVLIVISISSTSSAIYMTGYNNYYWYDMILNTPNGYFAEGGIYKFCDSPMYNLGGLRGVGMAIMYKSVPIFIAAISDISYINVFNYFIEKPFIKKMYGCGRSSRL